MWDKVKPFVGAIVGVVLAAYCPPCTASIWGAMAAGAAGAAANGGNILRGAFTGAISAAAFYGVGSAFQGAEGAGNFLGSGLKAADFAGKVFAHGMVGGVMSVLQGGKFGHGFASAGVTQAFSGAINNIGGSKFNSSYFDAGNRALRIVAAAAVGGTASAISGGKFANGAITGAFSRGFNDEATHNELNKRTGIAFRALNKDDRERLDRGLGLVAKNPYGDWSADKHVLSGSTPAAYENDPWISASTEINVSKGFDSGYGIIAIDLSKIETDVVTFTKLGNAWANKYDFHQKIIYHRAMWQQEVLIKEYMPREAITTLYNTEE